MRAIVTDECRRMAPSLQRRLDGELSSSEAARLESHLERCDPCRSELADFLALRQQLQEGTRPAADLPSGAEAAAWIVSEDRRRRARSREWLEFPGVRRLAIAMPLAVTIGIGVKLVGRLQGPVSAPPAMVRAEPAPAMLVVEDDERTGRRVLLAPAPGGG